MQIPSNERDLEFHGIDGTERYSWGLSKITTLQLRFLDKHFPIRENSYVSLKAS